MDIQHLLLSDEEYEELLSYIFEEELILNRTRWAIGNYLRGWHMNVPEVYRLGADPKIFLEDVRQQISENLKEELSDLGGVKFQVALRIQLKKKNVNGEEEYESAVFRSKINHLIQTPFVTIVILRESTEAQHTTIVT